jgi:hypothetical protein
VAVSAVSALPESDFPAAGLYPVAAPRVGAPPVVSLADKTLVSAARMLESEVVVSRDRAGATGEALVPESLPVATAAESWAPFPEARYPDAESDDAP